MDRVRRQSWSQICPKYVSPLHEYTGPHPGRPRSGAAHMRLPGQPDTPDMDGWLAYRAVFVARVAAARYRCDGNQWRPGRRLGTSGNSGLGGSKSLSDRIECEHGELTDARRSLRAPRNRRPQYHPLTSAESTPSCVLLGMGCEIEMRIAIPTELRRQDELAFEQIVFRQRHRLFTLALGILRDRGEAEDAVQETLI